MIGEVKVVTSEEAGEMVLHFYTKVVKSQFEARISEEIMKTIDQKVNEIVAIELKPIITRVVAEYLSKEQK